MRLIAHLSDLHFGRIDPAVVRAALVSLNQIQPHLVVVSGDFTQRARSLEFRQAKAFLDSLPGEKILVPGNHDVPLRNPFARFFWPFRNYRRFLCANLQPVYNDEEVAILGINTARSLTWKDGRINFSQAVHARKTLCRFPKNLTKIVVTHHPFDLAECYDEQVLVGRARMAMEELARCGADILLAGHFHQSYTGGTAKRYQIRGHSALVVQAGTATSTRLRGHANSFNLLRIAPPRVDVEILTWDLDRQQFQASESKAYIRDPEVGFQRLETRLTE